MALGEVPEQLAGAPGRVRSPGLGDQALGLRVGLGVLREPVAGAVERGPGAAVAGARDLLVDGGPGDAKAGGELGDGAEAVGVGGDEAGALHRRVGGLEGRGLQARVLGVSRVPGLF